MISEPSSTATCALYPKWLLPFFFVQPAAGSRSLTGPSFTDGGLIAACSSVASISVPWRTISPRASSWRLISSKQRLGQPVRRQLLAKAPDRRMVGNTLIQRQTDEAAKRQSIVHRLLQTRVGQPVPLLQQQQLHITQKRIRRPALIAPINPIQQLHHSRPVNQLVNFIHPAIPTCALINKTVRKTHLPQITPRHDRHLIQFSSETHTAGSYARISIIIDVAGDA